MEKFRTPDVDLAAFLRCKGVRYDALDINPAQPDIADFLYFSHPLLEPLVDQWAADGSHTALPARAVDAKEFGRVRRMFFKNAQRFVRANG